MHPSASLVATVAHVVTATVVTTAGMTVALAVTETAVMTAGMIVVLAAMTVLAATSAARTRSLARRNRRTNLRCSKQYPDI